MAVQSETYQTDGSTKNTARGQRMQDVDSLLEQLVQFSVVTSESTEGLRLLLEDGADGIRRVAVL